MQVVSSATKLGSLYCQVSGPKVYFTAEASLFKWPNALLVRVYNSVALLMFEMIHLRSKLLNLLFFRLQLLPDQPVSGFRASWRTSRRNSGPTKTRSRSWRRRTPSFCRCSRTSRPRSQRASRPTPARPTRAKRRRRRRRQRRRRSTAKARPVLKKLFSEKKPFWIFFLFLNHVDDYFVRSNNKVVVAICSFRSYLGLVY